MPVAQLIQELRCNEANYVTSLLLWKPVPSTISTYSFAHEDKHDTLSRCLPKLISYLISLNNKQTTNKNFKTELCGADIHQFVDPVLHFRTCDSVMHTSQMCMSSQRLPLMILPWPQLQCLANPIIMHQLSPGSVVELLNFAPSLQANRQPISYNLKALSYLYLNHDC